MQLHREDRVWRLTHDDPETRNALTTPVLDELASVLREADELEIGCVVISGSERWFASGADLRELAGRGAEDMYGGARLRAWDSIFATRTPLIASVSGLALGGGFELVLACDIVVASETARFGLPETSLGLIPGAGGTQRLIRSVGKALAMDVILAGRILDATGAERHGVASRLVAPDRLAEVTMDVAHAIAERSPLGVKLAKEATLAAAGSPLGAGLALERHKFLLALESDAARNAIAAFLDKKSSRDRAGQ